MLKEKYIIYLHCIVNKKRDAKFLMTIYFVYFFFIFLWFLGGGVLNILIPKMTLFNWLRLSL